MAEEEYDPTEPSLASEEEDSSVCNFFVSGHDKSTKSPMRFSAEAAWDYVRQHQNAQVLGNVKFDVDGLTWHRGDLIGTGAFGSVYLATLKKLKSQQPCPFPPRMAVKSAELFDSDSLKIEKQVLSILHNTNYKCPYVIKCFGDEYTMGEHGENVYNLLLEYASGGTLRDLIKKSRGIGLPESDVRLYTRSILLGIKHVHDCGLVHLDIKPDNILLFPCASCSATGAPKFLAKICDFGLAKKANQGKSAVRGTEMYLSPEAVTESIQEAPSDVWAIGCVVLELLTTRQVWERKPYWSTEEFICKIGHTFGTPKIPIGISEEAKGFMKGCFQRRAEDRLTVDMLLEHPFVLGLVDGENIVLEAEESEQVMDENYDELEENLDTEMPKNGTDSDIEPYIENEEDIEPYIENEEPSNTKPRLGVQEDPSMCSSDYEPSIEVYFHEDAEAEPIEGEGKWSPGQMEPSVVYLGTVTNHEKRSWLSDETIHNHKRRKLMSSSDADCVDQGEFWIYSMPQFSMNAILPEQYASALCAAF